MISAQLQLPFVQAEATQEKQESKSQEKSSNTNASAKVRKILVKELLYPQQDFEIVRLATDFVNDVDLNESIDVDTTIMSCIRIRNDINRENVNCFIAYDGDEAIGFLVGVTSQAFHRKGVVAEQKLCYVSPNKRGSTAAMRLVRAFVGWAKLNGATQIFTGTANNRYAEKTSKLFEQLGFRRVGYTHVMEI